MTKVDSTEEKLNKEQHVNSRKKITVSGGCREGHGDEK
tara:strand:+ start:2546 stop:2659 length:114 start_codon:yes stop_codon:yes gene_type:complete